MRTEKPSNLTIETVGLDHAGMHLQAPYGLESMFHALLINDSSHYVFACEILFEFVTTSGEIQTARKVVAYEKPLIANPLELEALLKTDLNIKPHSKTLIGLGVDPDLVTITGELPPPGNAAVVEVEKPDFPLYRKLIVRLNAVVIETGEVIGSGAAEFSKHLQEILRSD